MNQSALDGRRFLVIDDQAPVRQAVSQMLLRMGAAAVEEAASAEDGLRLIGSEVPAFDAVFCDLQMPGRDGIEMLRDAARLGLQSEVVLMSGEDKNVLDAAGSFAREMGLRVLATLPKPFGLAEVTGAMQKLGSVNPSVARMGAAPVTLGDLQNACAFGEIVPYFQPKVDIGTGAAVGVEALARWFHPERGLIGPDVFVPMAEERGLIDMLTEIMLTRSMEQCRVWNNDGMRLRVSLNLSVDSLNRLDLPEYVGAIAETCGIEPAQIIMEVTESRFADDPAALLDITTRFRLKQFELSIDDFGTGFSGLHHLQRLPFTEIKVDRSFVTGAAGDPRARTILEASVKLARELGLSVVAEGVETREDWQLVESLGCDLAQGYFISPPMPAEEVRSWVDGWNVADTLGTYCAS